VRVELHQEIDAPKAEIGRSLSLSPLLSGPCTNLITYNHAALAGLSPLHSLLPPNTLRLPHWPAPIHRELFSCPLRVMQLLHRPVLRPITLSPPTRALRRNRWQPASTNLLLQNQRGSLPFTRTLATPLPPPFL
jgi:hypothetical protein